MNFYYLCLLYSFTESFSLIYNYIDFITNAIGAEIGTGALFYLFQSGDLGGHNYST